MLRQSTNLQHNVPEISKENAHIYQYTKMYAHTCVKHTSLHHTYCPYILPIHTTHTYCPYILPMHTAHTHCPYTLPIHTAHTYCPYILPMHTAHTHCPYTLPIHTAHTYCPYDAYGGPKQGPTIQVHPPSQACSRTCSASDLCR